MKKNLLKTNLILLGGLLAMASTSYGFDLGGVKLGAGPKVSASMNKASIGSMGSGSFAFGWGIGASTMLDLNFMAIELGLQYSSRRFSFNNLGGLAGSYAVTLNQFEIPLLAYYKQSLSDKLALRAGAGLQFDFSLGDIQGDAGSVDYGVAGLSKQGTSLLFDIGTDFKLEGIGTLVVDLRYGLGLNNRAQSGSLLFNDGFKTQYLDLGAGVLF